MPVIFKYKNFYIKFYSAEEGRMHVHALSLDGESIKIWLEPEIEIAQIDGVFNDKTVNEILKKVKENESKCKTQWKNFFK